MRHPWLVRSCVAAIVLLLSTPLALAGRAISSTAFTATFTTAVSEADGIWIAVIALAALAASGPASGRRGQ